MSKAETDYSQMSTEDFDRLLCEILERDIAENGIAHLLQIAGVYEILAEDFNNDVLEAWEHEQARGTTSEDDENEEA